MSANLIGQCQGKWRGILLALGISASSLTGRHAPCPICGGKDRFRFDNTKPTGSGSWLCNCCGSGYGIHLAQKVFGWDYRRAATEIEAVLTGSSVMLRPDPVKPTSPNKVVDQLRAAHVMWHKSAKPVDRDDPVGRYLAGRGIVPAAYATTIRFGRIVYLDEDGEFPGALPAMIAVVFGKDGHPVGVHRTYLTSDGRKADVAAPRKMLGTLPDGAAVRLAEHGEALGIAEGIETALSATALFGVPCWSAINSSGLAKWSPPAGVTEVVIFGDNDPKFGGQAAAWSAAHRLACAGLTVRVEIPPTTGEDWNDVLMRKPV